MYVLYCILLFELINVLLLFFFSAPCLPKDVKFKCQSGGAAVSWNATYGTANFSLTAIVNGSVQTLCTTQQNSCNVTGLSCGQTYNISLTASNSQCAVAAPTNAGLTTSELNVCFESSTVCGSCLVSLLSCPSPTPLFRSLHP